MSRAYTHPATKRELPSVTTVLDTMDKGVGLLKWMCNLGWSESRRIFKESGERGTRTHDYITHKLRGVPRQHEHDEGDTPYCMAVDAFRDEVWSRFAFPVLETEVTVYCVKCGYAGTLDAIGAFERKGRGFRLAIADWKTTSAIRPEVALQLAAYLHAYIVTKEGLSCRAADRQAEVYERWAFRFGENGEYEPRRFRNYGEDIRCFRALLVAYSWRQRNK